MTVRVFHFFFPLNFELKFTISMLGWQGLINSLCPVLNQTVSLSSGTVLPERRKLELLLGILKR